MEGQYKLKDGKVVSPGKFEGEPEWVVFFWEAVLDGCGEDNEDGTYTVYVENTDIEKWPELQGTTGVVLDVDDNGFVHHCCF